MSSDRERRQIARDKDRDYVLWLILEELQYQTELLGGVPVTPEPPKGVLDRIKELLGR